MSKHKTNLCDGCTLWPCGTHAPIGVDGCIVTECANRKPTSGETIASLGKMVGTLKAQRDELQGFAEDIARNYDHDEDAHRYGTPCRVCRAEAVLKMVSAISNAEKMP